MKLFSPDDRDCFVFAVVPVNAKEGTPPEYKAIQASGVEQAMRVIDDRRCRLAAPHCMGRYDHLGRYMTYQPPVEGVRPGKFILHPLADQEYKASRDF